MPKKKHAFRGMKKSTKMSILSCKKKNILVFVSPILIRVCVAIKQ